MNPELWAAGLNALQDRLGHRFADPELLATALTHRSWAEEAGGVAHNERLEFLGDSVIQLAVTELLFRRFPQASEGQLSQMRSKLIDKPSLSQVGRTSWDLGPLLRLGRGEDLSGGREKESILANAVEAVLGALYLDTGSLALAFTGLELALAKRLVGVDPRTFGRDPKNELQERSVKLWPRTLPVYQLVGEEGPAHARVFRMAVKVGDQVYEEAQGNSKKEAERQAAIQALQRVLDLEHAQTEDSP